MHEYCLPLGIVVTLEKNCESVKVEKRYTVSPCVLGALKLGTHRKSPHSYERSFRGDHW